MSLKLLTDTVVLQKVIGYPNKGLLNNNQYPVLFDLTVKYDFIWNYSYMKCLNVPYSVVSPLDGYPLNP